MIDFIIVGAGCAGATVARVLAEAGRTVRLFDKRPHVAGNAHDEYDAYGVLIHRYGPHIFHTQDKQVFDFLSRF
ncbi:MAG: FAD-dependent oxidoreductase, partial [Zoogloeaceae bacterium]|nr:FAD-dependent oxidoreductase [Zoogloeaceae bacterium]